jgi:2-keto-4-pentenoate hydratase/2-oxohepta-3-ene-1,7-dioic acid hydratase in catechol pathway
VTHAPDTGAIVRAGSSVVIGRAGEEPLRVVQILGIGRNYAAHADEQGAERPVRPLVFSKNPCSVILDGEAIEIPEACRDREQVDYEGELAFVIGADCRDVGEDEALAPGGPVIGYCVANDVSARWWQKLGAGGQFFRGKSFDTFCPLGPRLTPIESVPDPQSLTITTTLSGEVVQKDTTASMLFPVRTLVAELSRGTTLPAGTVVLTGTPSGVGMAREPQRFLRDGDEVRVEIQGLGAITNPVRA